MRKKIFLFIVIIVLAIPFLVSSQTPLEITYPAPPSGGVPTTVQGTTLAQYVRYIYNISFGVAAIIAFAALIYAGLLYLSSAGNANKIREAKSRIFSALLGMGILLIAYVLLVAINPETVMLITPRLPTIPSSPIVTSIRQLRSETLGTVKEIGVMGLLAINGIENRGDDIFKSSLVCNCIFAEGLCLCTGGSEDSSCEPAMCYAGKDGSGHPCDNYDQIIKWQELLVFWLDELVYYQNRAVGTDLLQAANLDVVADEIIDNILENIISGDFDNILEDMVQRAVAESLGGEAKSLQKDIIDIVNPTITYYEDYIAALPVNQTDPRTIETLNNRLEIENNKLELKQDLVWELVQFSFFVEVIKGPIAELSSLTEQCALNTQTQCNPWCLPDIGGLLGGSQCHDTIMGCQAVCIGLNPCPIIDIVIAWGEFEALQGAIEDSAQEIIKLVDEIRQLP